MRARATAGAVAVAVAVAVALASPAAGQRQRTQPQAELTLASQTPWVAPGQSFDLRVQVRTDLPLDDVELTVAVHRRVASRSEFALTLDDRVRGSALLTSPATPLSALTLVAGAYQVRIPIQDPAQPPEPGRLQLRLRDDGVYPVRVDIRAPGGELLDRLTTHLVYAAPPEPGAPKLLAALVLPVHAPPALRPDGERVLSDDVRQRLADFVGVLDARADVPLTLAPTPETVQALAEVDDQAVAALRDALPGRRVLAGTYVPVDGGTPADPQLEAEAAAQVARGRRVLEDALEVEVASDTAVADQPIDERHVQAMRARGVERLVVPDDLLTPVDLEVTLTQPFELATRDVRRPAALAADTALSAHFTDDEPPVLRAHRFLADLAVLALDRPGRGRGAVVMPPSSWRPSAAFLGPVLDALADAPFIAPATVDRLFADVPPATTGRGVTLQRAFAPDAHARPSSLPVERIAEARRLLQSFSSMLDSANPLDDGFEEQLLVAQSRDLRPRQRVAYLEGLHRRVGRELSLVRVPEARTITLTARRGEIPVTVLSEVDYPVVVDVRVTSDRLGFPDGASRRVQLTRRNSTQQFSVEARGSGTFPLRVRLVSPDGSLVVGETRFTVRSTVFSGVGLVLSAGALGVLFAWWGRHFARGRRNRRLVAS